MTTTNTESIPAENYLNLLINHIDDPIWMVDKQCTIIACNRAFKKWVAHFIGCELDKGDNVLYNGQNKVYQEKFETCYQLAIQGSAFKSVEDMKVDDETRYTTVSFNPVYNGQEQIIGVSCHARDITEQRKHLLKIEEQNKALREIAFIESHKVRSPVANILGLEQLFNHDNLADPVNEEVIEGISTMTRQLDLIIREVVRKSNDIGLPQ